jgi:hypothetical protein
MGKEIEDLLREEIKNQIEGLSDFESGSEEKLKAIKGVAELYKLKIDEEKAKADSSDKEERRRTENDFGQRECTLKEEEAKELKKDRLIRACISGAELVLPLLFYSVWMKKGLKFEETGTFTSTTFRGLLNRFRPTK